MPLTAQRMSRPMRGLPATVAGSTPESEKEMDTTALGIGEGVGDGEGVLPMLSEGVCEGVCVGDGVDDGVPADEALGAADALPTAERERE